MSLLKSLNMSKSDGRALFEAYEKIVYDTDVNGSNRPKLKKSKSQRQREFLQARRKKWKKRKDSNHKAVSYEKRLEQHRIDAKKFVTKMGLGRSPLAIRCFKLMADADNHLSFPRFACHVWNWCTYDKVGLSHAAFVLYDSTNAGKLSEADLLKVLGKNYDLDNNYNPIASVDVRNSKDFNIQKAVKAIRAIASTLPGDPVFLKENEWHSYVKHHPLVLFPCFKVQEAFRECICGESFWRRMTHKRMKLQIRTGQIIDAEFVEHMIEKLGREVGMQRDFAKRKSQVQVGGKNSKGGNNKRRSSRSIVPADSDHSVGNDDDDTNSFITIKPSDICCVCKLRVLGYCSECIAVMKRSNASGDKNFKHKKERLLGAGNECCLAVKGVCGHLAHSSCMEAWLIECANDGGGNEDCPECFTPWTCSAREHKAGEKATAQLKNKVVKSISGVAKGKAAKKKKKKRGKYKGSAGDHPYLN